jgi:hypothetical protein
MTDDRSLERAARSWLDEGPSRAPDRTVEAALSQIQTTPQERDLRIPWRFPKMNPMTRIATALVVVALALGGVYLVFRPASDIGPPATASPGPPTIEGTWDVLYTREEMLAAGISDSGEDNPGNYGHFRLTFEAGRWRMIKIGYASGGGVSTYTAGDGIAHLYSPDDDVTFDIPYTVTATSLTFGRGGPVGFRVKPWTRITTEPMPTAVAGPLKEGIYDGPTLQVADIVAAVNADARLTSADRTQIINDLFEVKDQTTWSASIDLHGGVLTQRQAVDGAIQVGSFGRYAFPDDHTLVYTERIDNIDVVTVFELTVNGDSFTLHRTTPTENAIDEFVSGVLFESGPFVSR